MIYQNTNIQFIKMLKNLSAILKTGEEFAESKKFDVAVLLNSRLAPNQLNLIKQIQIATDTAKLCAARLTNNMNTVPTHADDETTLAELQTRILSVIDYLATYNEQSYSEANSAVITHARWGEKHMIGQDFATQYAIPNFYFHVSTAYAILRHNGVELGKVDYLGELTLNS